ASHLHQATQQVGQALRVVALAARLQLIDEPPVVPVHRDLLDLVEVGRVDLPGRYPQQEEVLLLPVPPAVERELHHVAENRLAQRGRVDLQPGLLEELAHRALRRVLTRLQPPARGDPVVVRGISRVDAVEEEYPSGFVDQQDPGGESRYRLEHPPTLELSA